MKVLIAMDSAFAFERLKMMLETHEDGQHIQVYNDNISEADDIEDIVDIFEPDLVVIDQKINDGHDEAMNENKDVETIVYHTSFDDVLHGIFDYFFSEDEDDGKRDFNYTTNEEQREIVYKDRVVEKEIFKTAYTSIPQRLIIVGSLWEGAGSTTLATSLAKAIAERNIHVAVAEHPLMKPYLFDFLSIPTKETEQEKTYEDLGREVQNQSRNRKQLGWYEDKIHWFMNDSRKPIIEDYSYEDTLQYLYSINASITILDLSSAVHDPRIRPLLYHADDIFMCIEPDIVRFDWMSAVEGKKQRKEKEMADMLLSLREEQGIPFHYVLTKYTKAIDNKMLIEGLGEEPVSYFPVFPYEELVKHTWESRFLYDSDWNEEIERALKPLIVRNIPKDFYPIAKNESKQPFLKKWLKGRK